MILLREYDVVTVGDSRVAARTVQILEHAGKQAGADLLWRITQGSYNRGRVAASAGTHDGGGVVDLSTHGLDSAEITRVLEALRRAGMVAWFRTREQGFDPHIHAIDVGASDLSDAAASQVSMFRQGFNGLASWGRDDGPRVEVRPWVYAEEMDVTDDDIERIADRAAERVLGQMILDPGADQKITVRRLLIRIAGRLSRIDGEHD